MPHGHPHAFGFLNAARRDGLLLSRRNLLKASLAGVGGLTLPALLHARKRSPRFAQERHSAVDGRRAEPDRHTRPQARPAAREPRAVRRHEDEVARRHHLRAPAETRGGARPVHRHSLGRLPAQQPRAEHGHADGEPARRTPREPRGPQLPGDRVAGCEVARRQPPAGAAVRRVHAVAQSPRVRRPPRQELRPVPGERGGAAAGVRPRRQGHRHALRREDVRATGRRLRGSHGRPAAVAQELRPTPRGHRPLRLNGGFGEVRTASGRNAHRRARPGRGSIWRRNRRPPATATANTSGASKRFWRGGWWKPAPRSLRSTSVTTPRAAPGTRTATTSRPTAASRKASARCCPCSTTSSRLW